MLVVSSGGRRPHFADGDTSQSQGTGLRPILTHAERISENTTANGSASIQPRHSGGNPVLREVWFLSRGKVQNFFGMLLYEYVKTV